MKVKTLLKKLSKVDPETEILCSSDMEGNTISELKNTSYCFYMKGKEFVFEYGDKKIYRRRLKIGIPKLTKKYIESGYNESDVISKPKKAIILFPNC